jgi:hypothetical protein
MRTSNHNIQVNSALECADIVIYWEIKYNTCTDVPQKILLKFCEVLYSMYILGAFQLQHMQKTILMFVIYHATTLLYCVCHYKLHIISLV